MRPGGAGSIRNIWNSVPSFGIRKTCGVSSAAQSKLTLL
jgi:hypothetical protein